MEFTFSIDRGKRDDRNRGIGFPIPPRRPADLSISDALGGLAGSVGLLYVGARCCMQELLALDDREYSRCSSSLATYS